MNASPSRLASERGRFTLARGAALLIAALIVLVVGVSISMRRNDEPPKWLQREGYRYLRLYVRGHEPNEVRYYQSAVRFVFDKAVPCQPCGGDLPNSPPAPVRDLYFEFNPETRNLRLVSRSKYPPP